MLQACPSVPPKQNQRLVMALVKPGIFLEQNRSVRPTGQFRVGRRSPVRPVIVFHTAECGTDMDGPDAKAENVARFIQNRPDAGSYHLLGDSDSILQLVRFENEAYQDRTGSNRWAIGISLAMNAGDWPRLSSSPRRAELIATGAQMAGIAGRWLSKQGLGFPEPVLLTKTQSDRPDASGFVSHSRRDPGRRTDPGSAFPWGEFFAEYERVRGVHVPSAKMSGIDQAWVVAQTALKSGGFYTGRIDGDPGPKTASAALAAAERVSEPSVPAAIPAHLAESADFVSSFQKIVEDARRLSAR